MEHERVLLEYPRRVLRRKIAVGLYLAFLIAVPLGLRMVEEPGWLVYGAFAAVMVGVGYWDWRSWRCPACEGTLGQDWNYEHCPKCGVKLKP